MNDFPNFDARAQAAMLAAAIGDALGWPQENRSGRVGGKRGIKPQLEFNEWRRRAGGQFANHEEVIGAGEYSDDTQLIAAMGRCLLSGHDWWARWTETELPLWVLYERGGGRATKRAAQAWAKGALPWRGETSQRYFAAGGNGVAMRVLPHLLRGDDDFVGVSATIIADGIATHGHPRALVGALGYAYALWNALRRNERLAYGALIDRVRDDAEIWSRRESVAVVAPDWDDMADAGSGSYDEIWGKTVGEFVDLLDVCADAMGQGALSVDRETLAKLGTFDKQVSSAGTVTAAGAIFLASRYASRPAQGLIAAAFVQGGDSDTLASMTGGLLAAINGGDWLGPTTERVQDGAYLKRLARELLVGQAHDGHRQPEGRPRAILDRLEETEVGAELPLPDGRTGRLRDVVEHPTKSRNRIRTFVVETDDGQTLFFKRISRLPAPPEPKNIEPPAKKNASAASVSVPDGTGRRQRMVMALEVADLERSLAFWRDIAHLEVKRSEGWASVNGYLALFPTGSHPPESGSQLDMSYEAETAHPSQRIVVFVDGDELKGIRERLGRAVLPVAPLQTNGSKPIGVCCTDPDGNVVEFRASNGMG